MRYRLRAFLIHDHTECFEDLEKILNNLSMDILTLRTCDSAESLFAHYQPIVVFIGLSTWEREHEQLAELAKKACALLSVIVVGTVANPRLYVSAIRRGAFSFIAPPFSEDGLNIIVHSAAMDVHERRDALARGLVTHLHV